MNLVDFLWAIPVFGLLIFIHELGHFAVAKFFDIRVHEFALGFGPVLAGFDRGETRYNLRIVPLGGFVRMAGMEEGESDDPRGFNRKSILARSLVIAAGPVMNFVLASILFSAFLFFIGTDAINSPILGEVPQSCEAVVAGQKVARPCPAFAGGLQSGDRILSINGAPVQNWDDILGLVSTSDGKPLLFKFQRGEQVRDVTIQPIHSDGKWKVGIGAATQPEPLGKALVQGPVMTARLSAMWLRGVTDMILLRVTPQLSGPVDITREIAQQASQGLDNLLWLTAFLSINLGMFNLLPIPALDGSRLLFMLVELVRGRRLDPHRENMVHFVGFLVLIGLMVVITYSEVVRR